jgi:hypothetical protein
VPFIFREVDIHGPGPETPDVYENIGECYLHGAMAGESSSWEDILYKDLILC